MPLFKFRLASVLRLREHVKDKIQWELRNLHEIRRQKLTEIEALEAELAQTSANCAAGQIMTAIELVLRAEHAHALTNRIKAKKIALAKFDEQLAEKRSELVEAMRAVKSLEQLRQRQEDRYRRNQNAVDQRFADEIAQRKFAQRANGKKIPS